MYFVYESDCCGTGFGISSTTNLHFSKSQELLYNYGLTNKQRKSIDDNISQRFIYPKETHPHLE